MKTVELSHVLISLVLVALAIIVSRLWKLPVQKDMAYGSVRAFVQLVLVGYALEYIFAVQELWLMVLAIMVMIAVGAQAASSRVKDVPNAFWIAAISITVGSWVTLLVMLALQIITLEARYAIPLAGMIVGNSMNSAALTIERISSALRDNRLPIETSLALGKNWREASRRFQKEAAVAGMISIFNFLKTVGIVALPGAMTGMILAGADPLEAVFLQLVVGYMLLSAVTITSIVALELTVRRFFTPQDQLVVSKRP
ncbi:MAG: ABC transporter permease [Planctomycetota bacterium]|jgi:putative ABC transport system permease protein